MSEITIGDRQVGSQSPPFVIAEMSANHNGSLERALAIVDAAAAAGADAIKIQTYTAGSMTLDVEGPGFCIEDPSSLWSGERLFDLYESAATPCEWHDVIAERARERGLICFSTPFDESAIEFLESLDMPCYKIASFENTDLPLITKAARTGKPLLISTGMATAAELDEAVGAARAGGCEELILLKCTSTYPAPPDACNLRTIPHLRDLFGCEVGLSDHTLGLGVALASVAVGACVVEKHLTLSRSDGGVDAAFSLEPQEMAQLVAELRSAWSAMGCVRYGPTESEGQAATRRRSLYFAEDLRPGDVLTSTSL